MSEPESASPKQDDAEDCLYCAIMEADGGLAETAACRDPTEYLATVRERFDGVTTPPCETSHTLRNGSAYAVTGGRGPPTRYSPGLVVGHPITPTVKLRTTPVQVSPMYGNLLTGGLLVGLGFGMRARGPVSVVGEILDVQGLLTGN